MNRLSVRLFFSIVLLTAAVALVPLDRALGAGATTHAWPSFRHDLLNSAAATPVMPSRIAMTM